jgi:tryptophanyl-tRNA synthetase
MWVFECLIATGQLERGHAYKDAIDKGEAPNAGIFNYPVLMAADIVLYDADVVPVGRDQKQHVEVARDLAVRLNHLFGERTVVVPHALIESPIIVPGVDGRKMGKTNDNAISIFSSEKALRQSVMKIVTGSEPLDAPKEPDGSTVFQIFKSIASEADSKTMADKLRAGGYGWGHAKQALADVLEAELAPKRPLYEELVRDGAKLDAILADGAERARAIAKATIRRVRTAIGID